MTAPLDTSVPKLPVSIMERAYQAFRSEAHISGAPWEFPAALADNECWFVQAFHAAIDSAAGEGAQGGTQ